MWFVLLQSQSQTFRCLIETLNPKNLVFVLKIWGPIGFSILPVKTSKFI